MYLTRPSHRGANNGRMIDFDNLPNPARKPTYTDSFIQFVYAKYEMLSGGFPQGYCGQVAEELQKRYGGEIVAGYIDYLTGRREHWWLDIGDSIIDPMFDVMSQRDTCRHVEVHRDISKKYW